MRLFSILTVVCVSACTASSDSTTKDTSTVDDSAGDTSADTSGGATVSVEQDFTGGAIVDATPDATATNIWYLDGSSLCMGPDDGSAGAQCDDSLVSAGTNLVVSPDGTRLVVAGQLPDHLVGAAGAIGALIGSLIGRYGATADMDNPFTVIPGTEGYTVTALDYPAADSGYVYFSGLAPDEMVPGIFRIPEDGGTAELVATGMATVPTGVVVASDGTIYSTADGALYEGDTAVATGITLGSPAGVALTPDDSTVMVSALSGPGGHSEVVLVNRTDDTTTVFDDVISANVGSGGLHRAQQVATEYAWCGVTTGSGGTVYRVDFK